MSLSVTLAAVRPAEVYYANITHNLSRMAKEAGIYMHLWRPKEIGITKAQQLIAPLKEGLAKLKEHPEHFRRFQAQDGWGLHVQLVVFVEDYLNACIENPDADVEVSR